MTLYCHGQSPPKGVRILSFYYDDAASNFWQLWCATRVGAIAVGAGLFQKGTTTIRDAEMQHFRTTRSCIAQSKPMSFAKRVGPRSNYWLLGKFVA